MPHHIYYLMPNKSNLNQINMNALRFCICHSFWLTKQTSNNKIHFTFLNVCSEFLEYWVDCCVINMISRMNLLYNNTKEFVSEIVKSLNAQSHQSKWDKHSPSSQSIIFHFVLSNISKAKKAEYIIRLTTGFFWKYF